MDEERDIEEIVTRFLLNTCRLRPQLSKPGVQAVVNCSIAAATRLDDDAHIIPLTTGSVAEFYIEPMLSCIGDVDVMHHFSTQLAIPRGQSPPTQLPAEFHNYVEVHEIMDSHFPGYVYLELRYLLTECSDEGKYNAVEVGVLLNRHPGVDESNMHGPGPAWKLVAYGGLFSCDNVPCVRCLSWPPQAADWPTRHRNYDWPDSATVDRVVNNGCDVVHVAHRQCRQHKWMSECQHRLSFSRAEIVLINSWMPVQQIVYHMLRVFMKAEELTSAVNSEEMKLSNYHIKTLMLWVCELKPKSWWTDDLSLIRIIATLLHILSVWLNEARCKHYFISNCNLVDNSFKVKMIASRLASINKSWLSSWFVNSYIRKCSDLCPHSVSRLFDDISNIVKLEEAVSAVVYWRLNNTLEDMCCFYIWAQVRITSALSPRSVTEWLLYWWQTELAKNSSSLSAYFIPVAFLHIARRISRDCLSDEVMDILAAIIGHFVGPRRHSNQRSSSLSLSKAAKLMKVVANNSRSTVQLIEIELSKAYLYRALRCKDSDSDSIYCLANTYLAVLYYITGQYQTAIDHCTLVMRSQDHSQCSSHVVQGKLLPKIDDDIDVVLGLAVFYQNVRTTALNQQQQTQHITVFTTELFTIYLHIKCRSVVKCQQLSDTAQSQSSTYQVQSCSKYISDMQQLYVADVLLWKSVDLNVFSQRMLFSNKGFHRCVNELNTSDLTELLQQSAVEHLTAFRQLEVRDFGSVVTTVTTDFEAMYAYKRGDYQRCLQLSTQNVHALLYAVRMAYVPLLPVFIQLLDDDIVSLTALTVIVNPARRDYIPGCCITQLTLSLYLMTQCQLKLCHSVTSLTQTLHYIRNAHRVHDIRSTLDHLTLKLIARCILRYLCSSVNNFVM